MKIMDDYLANNDYMDVHAWQFTPASFEIIISDLVDLKYLKFTKLTSFDTVGYEFFISLRKSESGSFDIGLSRLGLAKQCI